ncbi:hypothetical protein IGI39_000090 [Enterococcus sp. AZ135]
MTFLISLEHMIKAGSHLNFKPEIIDLSNSETIGYFEKDAFKDSGSSLSLILIIINSYPCLKTSFFHH